jgi:ribosome recycling factor
MAKLVSRMAEDTKTSVRNHRREANEKIKTAEKNKEISEDDEHRYFDEVQKLTDEFIKKIDEAANNKKQELMQV